MDHYRKKDQEAAEKAAAEKDKDRKPGDRNLRSGGVEGVEPDEALRGAAENKRLQENPPPLVHVDPTTGKPLDKPFDASGLANAEPNQLTTPGNPGVKDARNGKPT